MDCVKNLPSWQLPSDSGTLYPQTSSQYFDTLSDSSSDELASNSDPYCDSSISSSMGVSYRQRTQNIPMLECDRLETNAKRGNIKEEEEARKKLKCEYDSDGVTERRTWPTGRAHQPSAEDAEKRRLRRERNKQAAARCRQRRVDLTNSLLAETESLQRQKNELELEISKLQRQRNELEYVLEAHSPQCHVSAGVNFLRTKTAMKRTDQLIPSVKMEQIVDNNLRDCFKSVPASSHDSQHQRPAHLPVTAMNQIFEFPLDSSTGGDQFFTDTSVSTLRHCGNNDFMATSELLSPTTLLAL